MSTKQTTKARNDEELDDKSGFSVAVAQLLQDIGADPSMSEVVLASKLSKLSKLELSSVISHLLRDLVLASATQRTVSSRMAKMISEASQLKLDHARQLSGHKAQIAQLTHLSDYNNAKSMILADAFDIMRDVLRVFQEPTHWPENAVVAGVQEPWNLANNALNSIAVKSIMQADGPST